MRLIKWVIWFFLLLGAAAYARAQEFSYVYIQGDKSTPFYIKLDGEMLPRYGKNYFIIPKLAPGPINISVLFQQNKYPEQRFTIYVPDNGFRGFLLNRKDNDFSLYDLQYKFYLPSGNKVEDDLSPSILNAHDGPGIAYQPGQTNMQYAQQEEISLALPKEPVKESREKKKHGNAEAKVVKSVAQPAEKSNNSNGTGNSSPQFIDNIELNNQHEGTPDHLVQPDTTVKDVPPPVNDLPSGQPGKQQADTSFVYAPADTAAAPVIIPVIAEKEKETAPLITKAADTPMHADTPSVMNTVAAPEIKNNTTGETVTAVLTQPDPHAIFSETAKGIADSLRASEPVAGAAASETHDAPAVVKEEKPIVADTPANVSSPSITEDLPGARPAIPADTLKPDTAASSVERKIIDAPATVQRPGDTTVYFGKKAVAEISKQPAANNEPARYAATAARDTVITLGKKEPEAEVSQPGMLINTDCPQEMRPEAFGTVYRKTNERNKDEQKLEYLSTQLDKCYSVQQAKMLAKTFSSDVARYTFLKKVYPRIKDQDRFSALADLFSSAEWKASFLKLVSK